MDLAPGIAVLARFPFQPDDAVSDALELLLAFERGVIVKDERGAVPAREKLLKAQYFTPVSHRRLGKDLQLRNRVQHHTLRVEALDVGAYPLDGLSQLHVRWMINGVICLLLKTPGKGTQLEQVDT